MVFSSLLKGWMASLPLLMISIVSHASGIVSAIACAFALWTGSMTMDTPSTLLITSSASFLNPPPMPTLIPPSQPSHSSPGHLSTPTSQHACQKHSAFPPSISTIPETFSSRLPKLSVIYEGRLRTGSGVANYSGVPGRPYPEEW